MKTSLIIIVLIQLTLLMKAGAQISTKGIDKIQLGRFISSYNDAVRFDNYSKKKLFYANPTSNFYNIPIDNISDSSNNVKFIFAYADSQGLIKRIILFIDDSSDTLIDTLKASISSEYTTGQTSIGRLQGYGAYAWSTSEGDYILMMKDVNTDVKLNFPITTLEFTKRSDLNDLMNISFRVKSLTD